MPNLQHAPKARYSPVRPPPVRSVAVIGVGYVGLPLAILANIRGLEVRGFDIDTRKIRALTKGEAPFLSTGEARQLAEGSITFSADETVLDGADVYVICVPTPVDEGHRPDLAPLIAASESVGRHLAKGALVVIESTVNPGACEDIACTAIERLSGLVAEQDFFFAHCPERINPGDTEWEVRTIPRVLGAVGPHSLARATAFYGAILDGPLHPMASIKEAEAVKMIENAFRDVNIAFVNELAMSFARADIDLVHVIEGASTKPFSFLPHFPGCGVGGHCIPVDPYYLIRYGRENGFHHRFLETARAINEGMPRYTVDLAEQALREQGRTLSGATVALLGLAYKRDVPDLRESPALAIRDELLARGAHVYSFDPFAHDGSDVESVEAALARADVAILATDHSTLRALAPETFTQAGIRIVVDGRNCLDKEAFRSAGILYRGIGR